MTNIDCCFIKYTVFGQIYTSSFNTIVQDTGGMLRIRSREKSPLNEASKPGLITQRTDKVQWRKWGGEATLNQIMAVNTKPVHHYQDMTRWN